MIQPGWPCETTCCTRRQPCDRHDDVFSNRDARRLRRELERDNDTAQQLHRAASKAETE